MEVCMAFDYGPGTSLYNSQTLDDKIRGIGWEGSGVAGEPASTIASLSIHDLRKSQIGGRDLMVVAGSLAIQGQVLCTWIIIDSTTSERKIIKKFESQQHDNP